MSSALNINLTLSINSVLKKISDEEAEILIKTDAEIKADFKEETDLTEKLVRAVIT